MRCHEHGRSTPCLPCLQRQVDDTAALAVAMESERGVLLDLLGECAKELHAQLVLPGGDETTERRARELLARVSPWLAESLGTGGES